MEILVFSLADAPYGISIGRVEAIEHSTQLTFVPKSKEYVAGLINIRGGIVPAVDMTKFLKLNQEIKKEKLILIRNDDQPIALMVEEVDDVIEIDDADIELISAESGDISIINYKGQVITYIGDRILNKI